MNKNTDTAGRSRRQLYLLLLLSLVLVVFIVAVNYTLFIERYYSGAIFPVLAEIMQYSLGRIPFSVGDVFYSLLVIALTVWFGRIIASIFRTKFKITFRLLLSLLINIEVLLLVFYLCWGLNYFREPAAKRWNMPEKCCYIGDVKHITSMIIDSANYYRKGLTGTKMPANDSIYSTAIRAMKSASAVNPHFPVFYPKVKPSLLSPLMNYLGTSGYYNPFTGEAQVNYGMPSFVKPFTACHELSHQMGYASEDEANFGGYVACLGTNNAFFKYSAYYAGLENFMIELRVRDTLAFKEMRAKIALPVLADFKKERRYWQSFQGKAGVLSSMMYDNYLKLNNQPKGLKTYNEMVRLVTGWYALKNRVQSAK